MASLGQAIEDDNRTPFQRARLSDLRKYCDEKEISYPGNATKDKLLLLIGGFGDVDVNQIMPTVKATGAAKAKPEPKKNTKPKKATLTA